MKRNKSIYSKTLLRLNFNLDKFHGMFLRNGGRGLVNILKGLFIVASATITSGRIRYICTFVWHVKHLLRTQGVKGTVLYLKAAGVAVQQAIGGQRVRDCGRLGSRFARTNRGLPRFIPAQIRMQIRAGDTTAIKTTLTLINLFRVMEFPGKLKLNTITDPNKGTGVLNESLRSFMPLFVERFVTNRFTQEHLFKRWDAHSKDAVFALFKGGPGVKGAFGEWNSYPLILLRAYVALTRDQVLWDSLQTLVGRFDYGQLRFGLQICSNLVTQQIRGQPLIRPLPYLGKLGLKEEAAGKIRVFAMVDAWTQWALYPLHMVLFEILRDIRMDGTFDQTGPLKYLIQAAEEGKPLYSLDLSAATDRLPISIQRQLLSTLFGAELAGAWANLLVGRAYRLHDGESFKDLKYAVGQPMGALSSWASLAFIHHFLVQVAA
jgi:hypothetical protein